MTTSSGTSLSIKIAMAGALIAVLAGAYVDLRREQTRALEDFSKQQQDLARGYSEAIRARLDGVLRDLQTASDASAQTARREEVLRRLIDGEKAYRELDIITTAGVVSAVLAADHPPISDSPLLVQARATVVESGDRPIAISPPVRREQEHAHERLRLIRLHSDDHDVVLLVDVDRLFAGVADASTPAVPIRWLIVDNDHRWIALGPADESRAIPWRADSGLLPEDIHVLLSAMGQQQDGAMLIGRDAAEALGLGHRLAVAGYAVVPTRLSRPWSIAVVTSARRMRDRGRFATWRLIVSISLAGLLVALFGFVTLRQQRRTQRLAEALNLVEATAALRERSEKMIETIPIGILALDEKQRVVSVNPYLTERGVRVAGTLAEAFAYSSVEEVAAVTAMVAAARERGAPVERTGLMLHFRSGDPRHLDAYAIPLGRPLAEVDCFVALHDRTEVRALERSLVRAEKLATIGTLAAGVAHEVGTPLGIISGRAEQLLARIPVEDEAARKSLTSIMAQVDKVSTTIRQLLDFARIRPVDAATVTPAQALQSAAALLDHRFRHAKVALHIDASPMVSAVSADPGQLEQVLVNLLMNACDACAAGGNVWVSASPRGDRVAIEVRDDGSGIAAEHVALVLDPFFTTKKRGQGTGLGLTIAADIVKNHGGTLEIESVPGKGTTMRVLLPMSSSSAAAPATSVRS